jgi:hypothetical protein
MATSSRQSAIFGVNDWKTIYKTFSQANFQSYDYESLRKSFVDYLRAYYPETFNDYVESSEYVALLDIIAFMGQSLAFRDDLNTRENFIDTAERRDSVIKLANLVGYNPKRNLSGQGYMKVTAVQTSEQVRDINGFNLSNMVVLWNDPANPNWQEQFNSIINASLVDSQRVGRPGNSKVVLDVKTDEYSIRLPKSTVPTIPFSATVDGTTMNFEGVSVTSVDSDSLYEMPPSPSGIFNILYRNDKLGYGSPNTGFFMYFKQGSLQTFNFALAQQSSNQVVDIDVQGVNNTDTWLYNISSTSGAMTQWKQVESVYASKPTSLSAEKKLFSVSSRFNDQVSYVFGDGVFSEMPTGNFVAYLRTSNGLAYTIDPTEVQGTTVAFQYVSRTGRTETLTLTLELSQPVANAQGRETLQSIKERAPQRYYAQNRMVNGEDYNTFPYTLYSSIIKSRALNRSSVGVSRNFDLLDPSAKYSSTNDFADDGGLYEDTSDGYISITPNSNAEIVTFLTETLTNVLNSHRVTQHYVLNHNRYAFDIYDPNNTISWHQSTVTGLETTGYLQGYLGPISIGVYSTGTVKYITEGALLQFVAPSGYYFDGQTNRLIEGLPTPSDSMYIWTSVASVVGDGYNNGVGNLTNGTGPVTLTNTVPNGVRLLAVIPSFTNSLSNTLIQNCISNINLNKNFTLIFDNSMLANQDRWSVSTFDDNNYFVKFQSMGSGRYQVTYKSIAYYFASSADIRFSFDRDKVVFDPLTGKLMQDYITILKTNHQPDQSYPMFKDVRLSVVGQPTETDGYVDDYSVEVSYTDAGNSTRIKDPDFFQIVTGQQTGVTNTIHFTFFETIIDANLLTRHRMVPTTDILFAYPTKADIAVVKYEYPVGQLFYAPSENVFYKSVNDTTSANIVNLVQVSNYTASTGRQGLYFQYKHISGDTTRINPATTNIIDLYVVTQSYYTQYQNWIRDNTGSIAEPAVPTINELSQAYTKINDYKMLTDGVILNSVKFKPLFGSKAQPNLRATIKVIKAGDTTASESEIRSAVLNEINNYFTIDNWNFGDTFYFSELSAYLHSKIGDLVNSVVLVPNDPNLKFGDLYEIRSAPYEIFVNAAQATDIAVISALTPAELQTVK